MHLTYNIFNSFDIIYQSGVEERGEGMNIIEQDSAAANALEADTEEAMGEELLAS